VESWWGVIYQYGDLSDDFSPALLAAKKQKLSGAHYLLATPVRIQLGLRDSQCHFIPEEQLPSPELIKEFNQYFAPDFTLHSVLNSSQYILESNEALSFDFDKAYWPPNLVDYTQQLLASDSHTRKFLSEVQSWSHSKKLTWNGLYLWGNGSDEYDTKIHVKEHSEINSFDSIKLLDDTNEECKSEMYVINSLTDSVSVVEKRLEILKKDKNIQLNLIFSDKVNIPINHSDILPFWKRLFI